MTKSKKVVEALEESLSKRITSIVRAAVVEASHAGGPAKAPTPQGVPVAQASSAAQRSAAPRGPVTAGQQGSSNAPAHKPGGRCELVWRTLDALQAATGDVPTLKDILKFGGKRRWNKNNTRIEYYLWRQSKGIHGRQAAKPTGKSTDAVMH